LLRFGTDTYEVSLLKLHWRYF